MQPFIPPQRASAKEALIALRKKQAAEAAARASGNTESTALARAKTFIPPEEAQDRLRIIFDNSGSMQGNPIKQAKEGVVEFLRNCTPNATSVAIHLLNNKAGDEYDEELEQYNALALPVTIESCTLSSDLVLLASEVSYKAIRPTGSTPLYETLDTALDAIPRATRLVAFSDGCPDSSLGKKKVFAKAIEHRIPIDTVYISGEEEYFYAIQELKEIAEATGGIFLNLAKGDFAKSLKYLAPVKRMMLADSSFKSRVEKGEV